MLVKIYKILIVICIGFMGFVFNDLFDGYPLFIVALFGIALINIILSAACMIVKIENEDTDEDEIEEEA